MYGTTLCSISTGWAVAVMNITCWTASCKRRILATGAGSFPSPRQSRSPSSWIIITRCFPTPLSGANLFKIAPCAGPRQHYHPFDAISTGLGIIIVLLRFYAPQTKILEGRMYHLAKLLQKIIASQKNQHIACYYLLYHLAKLLQKIIASQKTNTSHHMSCYHLLSYLANLR